MDLPHQAVGLIAIAMATLPGQFGEIGLTSKEGTGLSSGILLKERSDVELSRSRIFSNIV